ncbi:MAG: peptidoglycan-binding protein [Clostridia bacterium]|nr:peptidoglycan-binding protein [Clostridia bacterium]
MPILPTIPETIVVHLGAPGSDAMNVTESFSDYIKNVASSEIFPTWPEEALKANIMAQISVALNRVFTRFYRNSGRDFDITNSPAYDQTYVYQRDIFANISALVDEIFDSYIRREGAIEPLFAEFCDGVEVTCNGLSQWGSVTLANEGLSYEEILRNYYGDDIEIVRNVPIENITVEAPTIPLSEGDSGRYVELLQIRLNRISANFPGIPKINPPDGFFDRSTTDAVKKFQEVFSLTPDGIVGRATWNSVNHIYNSVKKLYQVSSEGLRISELETSYTGVLSEGMSSVGVLTLQYYLSYIALFIPSVLSPAVDGAFGPGTRDAVISYQKTYGLPETGIVDEITWNSIENTYYGILSSIPYQFEPGLILPYPGRVLRPGVTGDDVRALQEYLNYIADFYPDIPKVSVDGDFGPSTSEAVGAFIRRFDLPGNPERVTALVWNALISVYDDLYTGNIVREEQFPGFGGD